MWRGVTIWWVVEDQIVAGWTVSEASSPQLRFFGALVIGAAIVLASLSAGFPRLTKPETGQPLATEAEVNKALIRRAAFILLQP